MIGKVQGMMGVELTPQQRRDFAQQAVIERWGKDRHVNLDELLTINRATYRGMKKIDSTGHFEADDEIGSVFEGIKLTIENLNNFVKGENVNG